MVLLQRGGGRLISIEPHITCDFTGGQDPYPPLDPHMNRGAVKTDRNRSLNVRTDKHAHAEFKRRIFDNEHCFVTTRFIYFL